MATKYNLATPVDPNPSNIITTSDFDSKGHLQASLTNWANTSKPNVAQESIIENGGTRFKVDTVGGDTISLTDPVTSSTVADGDVYIVMDGSGDFFFTATVPTWSDTKQGYYLTGGFTDHRAIGRCYLLSSLYYDKLIIQERMYLPRKNNITLQNDPRDLIRNTIQQAFVSDNTVFDSLSPYIPFVNNIISVQGGIRDRTISVNLIVSAAIRNATNTIVFYTLQTSDGATRSFQITDGGATTHNYSISW